MKYSREEREQRTRLHQEINKPPPPLVESNEETVRKLLSKQRYSTVNIINCVEPLLRKYGHDYSEQFHVIESFETFSGIFENFDNKPKPTFIIYAKREYCWILICIIVDGNKNIKVCYKDPFSNVLDKMLEQKIRAQRDDVHFEIHPQKNIGDEEDYLYGPLCLRNLKIVLESFQKESKTFLEVFKRLNFCTTDDVRHDRFSRVMSLTNEISKRKEFLIKLRKYIDSLPPKLSAEAIFQNEVSEDVVNECGLDIQTNFHNEMETVLLLLQIIGDGIDGKEKYTVLKNICDILGLHYAKIKSFFLDDRDEDDNKERKSVTSNSSNNCSVGGRTSEADYGSLEKLAMEVIQELDSKTELTSLDSNSDEVTTPVTNEVGMETRVDKHYELLPEKATEQEVKNIKEDTKNVSHSLRK